MPRLLSRGKWGVGVEYQSQKTQPEVVAPQQIFHRLLMLRYIASASELSATSADETTDPRGMEDRLPHRAAPAPPRHDDLSLSAQSDSGDDLGELVHGAASGSGIMSDTPQVLPAYHLKALKLPTLLREYDKVARQCAAVGDKDAIEECNRRAWIEGQG